MFAQRLLPLVPGRVRIQERQRQLLSKPVNLVVPDPELRPPAIVRPPTLAERKGRSSLTIKKAADTKKQRFCCRGDSLVSSEWRRAFPEWNRPGAGKKLAPKFENLSPPENKNFRIFAAVVEEEDFFYKNNK